MGTKRILHKRFCYVCGNDKTSHNSKGCENWYHPLGKDKPVCDGCYDRDFYGPQYRQKLRLTSKYKERYKIDAAKRYRYPGKRITSNFIQRTGYCSLCPNNLYDATCKRTYMHHWFYIIIFPWFGREELCNRCHNAVHNPKRKL